MVAALRYLIRPGSSVVWFLGVKLLVVKVADLFDPFHGPVVDGPGWEVLIGDPGFGREVLLYGPALEERVPLTLRGAVVLVIRADMVQGQRLLDLVWPQDCRFDEDGASISRYANDDCD
jgi:hypothetical protein